MPESNDATITAIATVASVILGLLALSAGDKFFAVCFWCTGVWGLVLTLDFIDKKKKPEDEDARK